MLRIAFITTTLILTGASWAQDSPVPAFTIDHVALSVTDLDRSVEFYETVFGLTEITDRPEVEGARWLSMGDRKEIHLLSMVEKPVAVNMAVHIALKTPDFDRILATLDEMNVHYSSWLGTERELTVRDDGTRQLYLRDPDGYWIEINSVGAD